MEKVSHEKHPAQSFATRDMEADTSDARSQVSFVDDKEKFMADLKNDKMADDKLHEGISGFDKDGKTLKDLLKEKLSA